MGIEKNKTSASEEPRDSLANLKYAVEGMYHQNAAEIAKDPAIIANFPSIKPEIVNAWREKRNHPLLNALWKENAARAETEMRMWIARNLFELKISPTKDAIEREAEAIVIDIDTVSGIPLFRDRHLYIVANNEQLDQGIGWGWNRKELMKRSNSTRRFMNPLTQQDIARQQGEGSGKQAGLARLGYGNYPRKTAKENIMKNIHDYPSPATFIFAGHGEPHQFLMKGSDHSWWGDCELTDDDLAECFIRRMFKHQETIGNDIFIFECCNSQSLIRNILSIMDKKAPGFPRPMFIAASEYAQSTRTNEKSKHGSYFYEDVLRTGDTESTFGTVLKHQFKGDSNVSIFLPLRNRKGNMRQIAQDEEWKAKGPML